MLLFPSTAGAQARGPAPAAQPSGWRTTISVNAGTQPTSTTESQNFVVQKNLENAPIATALGLGRANFFDAGVAVKPERHRYGANVSVSSASRRFGGDVNAQIPHPFFFNMPRPVSGTVSNLLDAEIGVHIDATYQLLTSPRLDLTASLGPSVLRVAQDLVTDVTYSESYPYDTATFVSAPTGRTSGTALGFNVGTDLTWKVSRRIGLGALVRYAHGSVALTPSAGNSVSATAGGLQLGGGVRFLY